MQYDHWKKVLEKHFERCNLEIDVRNDRGEAENAWNRRIRNIRGGGPDPDFAFDIIRNPRKKIEKFILFIDNHERIKILSYRPETRHLVLGVENEPGVIDRLLCGHDEREYFIASLPSDAQITTVEQAIESLKRNPVREAERRGAKVIRQGEWYFVPQPDFDKQNYFIHTNEPLVRMVRGRMGGTPHMVSEIIRTTGSSTALVETGRLNKDGSKIMQEMVRVNSVYARGSITHPDHKTVKLRDWHLVIMNREFEGRWNAGVTFLD